MESSSEVKRSTHVITLQPNETVLTAFPYGPHSSLLDFLKGEPKVLGAVQVLFALIIAGVGAIFAFNYFHFAQRFPLVFFTGYPFWGAFIFIITGYLTGTNNNEKCLGQSVTGMNVISSLVAVAGITLTIISYRYQHKYCQAPSLEGICVIGRVLYNGILSVLLIINIAQLGISVTVASFRSNCWASSNEIVFFLPSDVTQDSELSVPKENAVIQFELQEESASDDSITNIKPVFFGGYTFFKLRVTKNPLTFQCAGRRRSNSYYTPSLFVADEQQNYIPPDLNLSEEELELKPLPPMVEKKPSEIITDIEQLNDEDLQDAIIQSPEKETQLLQAQVSPLQVFPSYSVKNLQALPPQDLSFQDLPVQTLLEQALLSEGPTSHVTKSHELTSKDMPSQNTESQDLLSQYLPSPDMPAQDISSQRQVLPVNAIPFEATTLLAVQSSNIQHLDQRSLDLQLQNIQSQEQKAIHLSYQDIKSEVMLLTEEWKSEEELRGRKPSKQHSQQQQSKGCPCLKQKPLDLQIQDQQSPRKKSLDKHTKSWLSQKRHYVDKQIQVNQSILQLTDQQAEDLQVQEEKHPKQLYQGLQSQIQEYHDWQSPDWKAQSLGQQSQGWRIQDWKNKEWKTQEWQFEMQHSQNWESHTWQTQDLQVKESRKQKSLFQETQTLHAVIPPHLDEQLQGVLQQDSQHQERDQQDLQSSGIQKEDMETDAVRTRDIKPEDMNCGSQTPSDMQSEDMKPDFNCSSYQSSVQDTRLTCMSNINSEQDVQQNTSTCSTASKEDPSLTSTSCDPKETQQSEDSD
ncbi:membrane-spanning 4-domains subfamily A member 14 [Hippopotamus amphibius kiboko]|uniref:membrane-spanning 4-domains subfamily A member 14 n=1 Tax=Hippopotamus amphibius kiboko TaxID=575201 RepID=UPI00259951D9|nr:membrane-spanning 4-domains subfamily A member 14 [Hippopotamus amphibius kiboko]